MEIGGLTMIETVGELIDWLVEFDFNQEIKLERIEILPLVGGRPGLAGEYCHVCGFLERCVNQNAAGGS